jgi:hypothetical protein
MRTLIRTGFLSVALLAAFPADALAVLGWLEKLSGPGPFTGVQVTIPFACIALPAGTETADDGPAISARYDCLDTETDRRPLVVSIDIGRLTSNENDLSYANLDPRDKPDVNAFILIPAVSVSLGKNWWAKGYAVDLGAGAGAIFFSDDRHFFTSFWKPVLQPIRVGIKPIAFFRKERRWEFLEIAFNGTIIAGDLRARDFGATGNLDESNEWLWNRAVMIDLYKWFRAK